jgi:hypothetical protein
MRGDLLMRDFLGAVAGLTLLGSFHAGMVVFGHLMVVKYQPPMWLVRLNMGCAVLPVVCYVLSRSHETRSVGHNMAIYRLAAIYRYNMKHFYIGAI